MVYYGIKDKKTGQLLRQYFIGETGTGSSTSVISVKNVDGSLYAHIFLTKNKNIAMSLLLEGYCEYNDGTYKLDDVSISGELEIYETEFNL